MKLSKQHAPAEEQVAQAPRDNVRPSGSNESLAAQLRNSPRMVAQAQRTAATFGPANAGLSDHDSTHSSSPVQRETPPPTTHISLEDFVSHAEGEGCVSTSRDSGDFVGAPGGGYPHIHVWTNGKIALSVGHNRNYKIGEGGSIDIVKLGEELARGVPAGGLLNTIQWVLASAS